MSKHPENLHITAEVQVAPDKLAQQVARLRYDALANFLRNLAEHLEIDSKADAERGRPKLAECLREASANVGFAANYIKAAWAICEPYEIGPQRSRVEAFRKLQGEPKICECDPPQGWSFSDPPRCTKCGGEKRA